MFAYFTESVVFVLLELIGQGRASNKSGTQNLDSMQLLQEILPRKKIELASSEMELDSSTKKFSGFKNFKAASSSKHTTTSNHSRLKTDASADSIVKQEHLFSKFANKGASSSKEALKKSGVIISHPRSKDCSSFCKGKVILQASEAEQLNTRLKSLEKENEILKQAFLETEVERKILVNEICQLFQTLGYTLHHQDQEDGDRSSNGSLIIKPSKEQGGGTAASNSLSQVLLEHPGSEDPKANILAILCQSCTSTHEFTL
ncbi:hypothetical protein CRYUN_Cryun32bG0104300 [Craigia yunnanensis]